MHGTALVFMSIFWMLVIGLVVFVFCRLYCPNVDISKTAISQKEISKPDTFEEPDEVT